MEKISRETIRLLARHSDWHPEELDLALQREVQASVTDWHWLLRMLLLALGCGFLASGILFFFAYNWADIPKFGKLGLAAAAVVVPVILSLYPGLSDLLRRSLLTTGAFLVGPLFGVFGQIYQTGADTYDLFFAWALFVVVWAIVVDFGPMWLLFVSLLNVTLYFYADQVAGDWDFLLTTMLLFALNALAVVLSVLIPRYTQREAYPFWLIAVFTLAAGGCATVASCNGIMEPGVEGWWYTLLILVVYGVVAWYAINHKQLFYLIVMAFSLIAIGTAFIFNFIDDSGGFFLAMLWVVGTTVGSIYLLNVYRKAWSHEGSTTA